MEHTYNFLNDSTNDYNNQSPLKSNTYVYHTSESPNLILPEEKSLYSSDLEFPLPWKEPVGANMADDSDEEKKIKAEWFNFVKKRRLGKNWKEESNKLITNNKLVGNNNIHPNVKIHDAKFYEEWAKRRNFNKVAFTYKYFSWAKYKESEEIEKKARMEEIKYGSPCKLEILPNSNYNELITDYYPPNFAPMPKEMIMVTSPTEDKVLQEKNNNVPKRDLNVPNSHSPIKQNEQKQIHFNIDQLPLEPRKTIFKNPASGVVKHLNKNDSEAIISAEWEGKKIDIMFFKWNFLPKDREKLTHKDPLKNFLRIGQNVSFHGARTILGTDVYQTSLVYEGNNYPTLASRSGYNLKKWFITKDIYRFPRIATVKSVILPYHAAIDIEKPSRNTHSHLAAIMIEDLHLNKNDPRHVEGWIDEFIKPGDKIYVELAYLKDNSAGIKKAWIRPPEEIINPKKGFIPRKLPRSKFVFSMREGKSWSGTVRDVNENDGIFLTSIKDQVYEVHFNQVFIDGYKIDLKNIQTGDEISFSDFRMEDNGEYWCTRIYKGRQPGMNAMMKHYDEMNKDGIVDFDSVYAGKVVEFILPSHAVLKVKANNDVDIFVLLSKEEIVPNTPVQKFWIDKLIKLDDVLTFKIRKVSDLKYSAYQVCS